MKSYELLKDLIACPSITPDDAGAQDIIIHALKPLGFEAFDVSRGEVRNSFLRLGTGSPHFCFSGHTDVVPPGDRRAWRFPPFSATIEGDQLYGRGAADMKGNIACFIAATEAFLRQAENFAGSISFLITGDEEGARDNGTVKVLEWMAEHQHIPDFCLVGEPTNPQHIGEAVKIGRRGSLSGVLTVGGQAGHVAYPDQADNPLPRLIELLKIFSDMEFDQGSNYFPATAAQITSIDVGNDTFNVIPEKAEARLNIRFNDHWSAASLENYLRQYFDGPGIDYDLQTFSSAESFLTEPGPLSDWVLKAIQDVTGKGAELSTSGGSSDAFFIKPYCPVVEFGLINRTIHQVDEHVALSDLETLTQIYHHLLLLVFSQTKS